MREEPTTSAHCLFGSEGNVEEEGMGVVEASRGERSLAWTWLREGVEVALGGCRRVGRRGLEGSGVVEVARRVGETGGSGRRSAAVLDMVVLVLELWG